MTPGSRVPRSHRAVNLNAVMSLIFVVLDRGVLTRRQESVWRSASVLPQPVAPAWQRDRVPSEYHRTLRCRHNGRARRRRCKSLRGSHNQGRRAKDCTPRQAWRIREFRHLCLPDTAPVPELLLDTRPAVRKCRGHFGRGCTAAARARSVPSARRGICELAVARWRSVGHFNDLLFSRRWPAVM